MNKKIEIQSVGLPDFPLQRTGEGCLASLLLYALKKEDVDIPAEEVVFQEAMRLDVKKRKYPNWIGWHFLALKELNLLGNREILLYSTNAQYWQGWKSSYDAQFLKIREIRSFGIEFLEALVENNRTQKIIVRITIGDLYNNSNLGYLPHFVLLLGSKDFYVTIANPWSGKVENIPMVHFEVALWGLVYRLGLPIDITVL